MNSRRQIALFLAALAGVCVLIYEVSEGRIVPSWPGPGLGMLLARKRSPLLRP